MCFVCVCVSHVGSCISAKMQHGKCMKFRNGRNFTNFYEFHITSYPYFIYSAIMDAHSYISWIWIRRSERHKPQAMKIRVISSRLPCMQTFVFWLNSNISKQKRHFSCCLYIQLLRKALGNAAESFWSSQCPCRKRVWQTQTFLVSSKY